ncbi:MAG: oligosaccharide flippase family protein [Prevotella sp.]|nr:oligosaccharide flippase family protein [Prevotella sp.]
MRNTEDSSYRNILKYTSLFGSIQFFNILIALVRNKLVALILGPQGMGLNSLFNSTVQLLSSSSNMGLDTSAVRRLSEIYDDGYEQQLRHRIMVIRSWTLITASAGMLLCLLLSSYLSRITFSWGNHTLHFALLSPAVAMLTITGSESAILKSLRQLSALAKISIINVILALLLTTPILYFYGQKGIVPSILIISFTQMVLTCRQSYRLSPLRLSFNKHVLSQGSDMLKLGISFVLAGVFAAGADFAIRSILNNLAELGVVGLYNAGFMMTTTYAGMVFSSMTTDFFPRLSAVNRDVKASNLLINRQIIVSLIMIAPMLIAFVVGVPVIVPLLYSEQFMPVVPMIQITVLAMFLRAMKLPVGYLTLAKGMSRDYFLLEAYSAVVMVAAVIGGFLKWGLLGTGVGLLITGVIDFFVINIYARIRFGYRVSSIVIQLGFIQFLLLLATYMISLNTSGAAYWLTGIVMTLCSAAISLYYYNKRD